jgi:hypothetical protein
MNICVNVDVCDNKKISGWAINNDNLAERIVLDLFVNERFQATIFAQSLRLDLAQNNIGDGKYAFQYHFSSLIRKKEKAKITLALSQTGEIFYNKEVTF